jgi:hypothetical protein
MSSLKAKIKSNESSLDHEGLFDSIFIHFPGKVR